MDYTKGQVGRKETEHICGSQGKCGEINHAHDFLIPVKCFCTIHDAEVDSAPVFTVHERINSIKTAGLWARLINIILLNSRLMCQKQLTHLRFTVETTAHKKQPNDNTAWDCGGHSHWSNKLLSGSAGSPKGAGLSLSLSLSQERERERERGACVPAGGGGVWDAGHAPELKSYLRKNLVCISDTSQQFEPHEHASSRLSPFHKPCQFLKHTRTEQ